MIELRPDSHVSAFDRRLVRSSLSGTATGAPSARRLCACWDGTLGFAAPVSGNIAASSVPGASRSSGSWAAESGLRHKRRGISTYKITGLKPPLESTLTEENSKGTVGASLPSWSASRIKRFRMTSLQEEGKQLFCNDILAKKCGGHPRAKVLL